MPLKTALIVWTTATLLGGLGVYRLWTMSAPPPVSDQHELSATAEGSEKSAVAPRFEVSINEAATPAGIRTGVTDRQGNPVLVSCATCHATRPPNLQTRHGTELTRFHQGLTTHHGGLRCVACHNAEDGYQSLHLADGRALAFSESMTLCAQCHGPQFRDYQHGSHGGMTGYWDLSRGPRTRNHCTDCHASHAPAFSPVLPAPGPRDRFLPGERKADH